MTDEAARGGAPSGAEMAYPTGLSRAVLVWERLVLALWKPFSLLLIFTAIALSGVLPAINPWLHLVILVAMAGALIYVTIEGVRAFKWPGDRAARRRLERVNTLAHRPLETLNDRPSDPGDPVTTALWREHRRRVLAGIEALSIGGPRPQLAGRDPMGLRLCAGFFAVLALAAAGTQAPERLVQAVLPSFGSGASAGQPGIDAWITPPNYTGLAPVFIARADDVAEESLPSDSMDHAVPVGSRLVVQVTGARETTELVMGDRRVPLDSFAADGRAVEVEIVESGPITVLADDAPLASWTVTAIPDAPPDIAFTRETGVSANFALSLPFVVSDDYGVDSVVAVIERADRPAGSSQASPANDEQMTLVSVLPAPDPLAYGKERVVFRDFTAHPWAGGPVRLTLVATDSIDQEGRSETVEIVLPARPFTHPVAQAIANLRRELAWHPAQNYKPVARDLRQLAWRHEEYGDDPTVFLALKEASRRLLPYENGGPPPQDVVDAMIVLMWKTALYLEDGGVSLALARLRAAEQALMDALAEGADIAELERLMDELQSAMNEYLQAMQEQFQQRMAEGEDIPQVDPDARLISPSDIDEMMEEMREMMRNGMAETAQQMLEQLRRMMENMQAGMQMELSPEGQEAMKMLEDMQDLMEGQRELMDRTHDQSMQGDRSGDPQSNGGDGTSDNQNGQGNPSDPQSGQPNSDAILQEALRRQLGEIMRQFGEMMDEIPEPFGRADEGMSESAERLRDGDPRNALESQGDALDALQEAAESARDAFMERFQNPLAGLGQQQPGQQGQNDSDPFGRQPSEAFRGPVQGDMEIPDEGSMERAREIRDELRRRAGERNRPDSELEYIDRLLDQFR